MFSALLSFVFLPASLGVFGSEFQATAWNKLEAATVREGHEALPFSEHLSQGEGGANSLRGLLENGDWEQLESLPETKTMGEVSAGVLTGSDGKAYMLVIGQSPGRYKSTSTMIYDFAADTWTVGSPREHVGNHHGTEVAGNSMIVLGGLDEGLHTVQIAKLKETAGGIDVEWSEGANVPIPSGSANTALIGGKIYYCGGIEETNTKTISDCMIYDIASDSWTGPEGVPPMPEGRNHAASCSDGKKMIVFGGRIGGNRLGTSFDDTQIFTPGSGWTTGTPVPVARGGMGKAVYYKGECYVFGGEVDTKTPPLATLKINPTRTVYRVDVYNIAQDSWREAEVMPTGMHGIFPVLHKGKVHIAAGGTEAGYSQSSLHYALTLSAASKPPAKPDATPAPIVKDPAPVVEPATPAPIVEDPAPVVEAAAPPVVEDVPVDVVVVPDAPAPQPDAPATTPTPAPGPAPNTDYVSAVADSPAPSPNVPVSPEGAPEEATGPSEQSEPSEPSEPSELSPDEPTPVSTGDAETTQRSAPTVEASSSTKLLMGLHRIVPVWLLVGVWFAA